jgi:hypothetical protein
MWRCQSGNSLAKTPNGFASATTPVREAFAFVVRLVSLQALFLATSAAMTAGVIGAAQDAAGPW